MCGNVVLHLRWGDTVFWERGKALHGATEAVPATSMTRMRITCSWHEHLSSWNWGTRMLSGSGETRAAIPAQGQGFKLKRIRKHGRSSWRPRRSGER